MRKVKKAAASATKAKGKGKLSASRSKVLRKPLKAPAPAIVERVVRESSKLARVIAMLRTPQGSTIEALCKATGWQSHSVRGAISGAIKKKLGLTVASVKADGVRTYRINS